MANASDFFTGISLGGDNQAPAADSVIGGATGAFTAERAQAQSGYRPFFNYANAGQTDADVDGSVTEAEGKKRGTGWTRDTILELNLYGDVVPADQIMGVSGGQYLLDQIKAKRGGRRGFFEALATGHGTDFVPYANDLVAGGIAISDMSKARDAFDKLRTEGAQALTLQEKVWLKSYEEESIRLAQQTWGGTVGSIVRQAPAFAAEFLTTGGIFKAGTGIAKLAVKEGIEASAEKLVQNSVKSRISELAVKAGTAVTTVDDDILKGVAREAAAKFAGEGADVVALESRLLTTARLAKDAALNPNKFKGFTDWTVDYLKRGVLEHDHLDLALPPGWKAKLAEAAGVAFIEAPVRGGLYAAFDFTVANPLIAHLAGASETVTRNELMFASSRDPEVAAAAKWLAFGSAWAEYASENAGRAFNAVFGIAADFAGAPARALAKGAMAALPDQVQNAFKQGSYVRRMLAADSGFGQETSGEAYAAAKAAIAAKRMDAAKRFAGTEGFENMTAEQILGDSKLTNQLIRKVDAQNSEKAFFGYWLADKMVTLGWSPLTASKWLKRAGYDDLVGEFMEERYNGFAQGLFGLDGATDKEGAAKWPDRLARAAKQFFPDTWGQATAEIVAFAIPMAGRAMVNRAYASLGGGPLNAASALMQQEIALSTIPGMILESESGKAGDREFVRVRETGTPEEMATRGKAGQVIGDLRAAPEMDGMAKNAADVAEAVGKFMADDPGIGQRLARGVLGLVNAAITGNPLLMFNNPVDAAVKERLGARGAQRAAELGQAYRTLFEQERRRRVSAEAEDAPAIADMEAEMTDNGKRPLTDAQKRVLAAERARTLTSTMTADIDKAIRPKLEERAREIVKRHLYEAGTTIVENRDIESLVADLRKENGGKLPAVAGKAYETDAEFKKDLRAELRLAASERMSTRVVSGAALTSLKRLDNSTNRPMAGFVDRMFAGKGALTYFDLSTVADHRVLQTNSFAPIDIDQLVIAASVRDPDHASDAEYKALSWVRNAFSVKPSYSAESDAEIRDRARQIVAVNRHLLMPSYNVGGSRVRAVFDNATSTYSLPGLGEGFKTFAELNEGAAAQGFTAAEKPRVFLTPYDRIFADNPAEFAALFKDYFKGEAHAGNPYLKVGQTSEGGEFTLADARAEDRALRLSVANGDAAAKATVEAYDAAAKDVLEAQGRRLESLEADPQRRGYTVIPSAASDAAGNVYIPMKAVASKVGIVEDSLEGAMKRNPGAFLLPIDGRPVSWEVNAGYRPAVKAFMTRVQYLCAKHADDLSRKSEKTETEEKLEKQLNELSRIADPNRPNIEISKFIAGIVLYYGDSAITSIGQNRTEGAYYPAIGMMAKEARGAEEYKHFLGAVAQGVFLGTQEKDTTAFQRFVSDLMPPEFRDGTEHALPLGGAQIAAVPHVATQLQALANEIKVAETYLTTNPEAKLVFDAMSNRDAYLNYYRADLPVLMREITEAAAAAPVPSPATPEAAAAVPAPEPAKDPDKSRSGVEGFVDLGDEEAPAGTPVADKGVTNSLLEGLRDPAQAALLAETAARLRMSPEIMARLGVKADTKLVLPGDPEYMRKAFAFWKLAEPALPEVTEAEFVSAFAESTGAFKTKMDIGNEDPEASTDDTEDDAGSNDAVRFDDDGIRKAFEKYPAKKAAGTVLGLYLFNPARNESFAGHVHDLYMAEVDDAGAVAKDGVAALLSLTDGETLHPALVRESFQGWIDVQKKGASRLKLGFLTLLDAMGYDQALRFLTDVRGITVAGAVKFEDRLVRVDAKTTRVVVEFETDKRTTPAGARGSLETAILGTTQADAEKARSLAGTAAGKLRQPLPATLAARALEIGKRLSELAEVSDLLFGDNSYLSSAFRSRELHLALAQYTDKNGDPAIVDRWLTANQGKGRIYPGFLYQRLQEAADAYRSKKDNEVAVSMLFRDNVVTRDPSVRGALNLIFSMFAGTTPMEKAMAADGRASVPLAMPMQSSTIMRVLSSDQFRDSALTFFGYDRESYAKASSEAKAMVEKAVARMRRFGVWPNGTPVIANIAGLVTQYKADGQKRDREEVFGRVGAKFGGLSSAAAVNWFERAYGNEAQRFTGLLLPSSDKSNPLAILVPKTGRGGKSAVSVLTGKDTPTYAELYDAVAAIAGAEAQDNKRIGAVMLGYGPTIPLPAGTVSAFTVPQEDLSAEAAEAMFGELALVSSDATSKDILKTLAGGRLLKAHATATQPAVDGASVMIKGLANFIDPEQELKNPTVSESEESRLSLYKDMSAGLGKNVLWGDMDGAKVTFVNSKVSGVSENGKPMPAYKWLMAHPEATPETEVMWQGPDWKEPRKVKLADVAPGLQIKRDVKLTSGKLVTVIAYAPPGLRLQETANLTKAAKPVATDIPRNAGRDQSQRSSVAEQQLLAGAAWLWELGQRRKTGEPVRYRDPYVAAAVASGKLDPASDFASRDVASGLARRAIPEPGIAYAVKAANIGGADKARADVDGPAFTKDGALVDVASPYGAQHPLSHGERGVGEGDFNGLKIKAASIQANVDDPLFRYALRPNLAHDLFRDLGDGAGHEAVMRKIEIRLKSLQILRNKGDRSGYLKFLAEEVVPAFLNLDGSALPRGQIFSFEDLFVTNPDGDLVFDRTAFETDDQGLVLNGGRVLMLRVPSGGPDAWVEARVFAPVTADLRSRRTMAYEDAREDGSPVWKTKGEVVKDAAESVALVRDNAEITAKTGNDHDGDTAFLFLFQTEASGMVDHVLDPSTFVANTPEAAAMRAKIEAAVTDPVDGERNLRTYNRWVWNAWLESKANWLRNAEHSRVRDEGPAAPDGVEFSPLGSAAYATSAEPLDPEFKKEMAALFPVPKPGPAYLQAALVSDNSRSLADARGSAVHTWGILHQLLLTFDAVIPGATAPVLVNADGTPVPGSEFKIDRPYSDREWALMSRVLHRWSNSYFDSTKGDATASYIGMDKALVPLHFIMVAALRPKSRAEYQAWFRTWAKWAAGDVGRGIVAHSRAQSDSDYADQGFGPDPVAALSEDTLRDLTETLVKNQAFARLRKGDRDVVIAAAAVYMNRGADIDTAVSNTQGLTQALSLLSYSRAAMKVLEVEHTNTSTRAELTRVAQDIDDAGAVLSGSAGIQVRQNADVLTERIRQAQVLRDKAVAAFNGTYENSEAAKAMARQIATDKGAKTVSRTHFEAALGRREEMMRSVYASAAKAMIPADTVAKIRAIIDRGGPEAVVGRAKAKIPSRYFMARVEEAYRAMFKAYASFSSGLANTNAFFDMTVAPAEAGDASETRFIQTASRDMSGSGLGSYERGLAALAAWDAEDTRLDVKIRRESAQGVKEKELQEKHLVQITPKDMYWMLWLYTNMTGLPSLKLGRGSANFAAAFGPDMLKQLSDNQVRYINNRDLGPEFVSMAKYMDTSRGASISDVLRYGPKFGSVAPAAAAPAAKAVATDGAPSAAKVPEMKPEPAAVPQAASRAAVAKAENIVSAFNLTDPSTDFGRRLTNVTRGNSEEITLVPGLKRPVSAAKGASLLSAESWYQTNKAPQSDPAQDAKDMATMQRVIEAKLREHPDLVAGIRERGGAPWLEASRHLVFGVPRVRPSGFSWEGVGMKSGFLRALAAAYRAVTAENAPATPVPSASDAHQALVNLTQTLPQLPASKLPSFCQRMSGFAKGERTEAQMKAAADTAAYLTKIQDLPGVSPKAAKVLEAGAAIARGYGLDGALIRGTLAAAADAGAGESAEALRSRAGAAGVDLARLQILRDNADTVFNKLSPDMAAACYVVAYAGFPTQKQGAPKTSELAAKLLKLTNVEPMSYSLEQAMPTFSLEQASEIQSDLKITDEELELYAAQRGPYELSDDLHRKVANRMRLKGLQGVERFEVPHGAASRDPLTGEIEMRDGVTGTVEKRGTRWFWDNVEISAEEAADLYTAGVQDLVDLGQYALVAQAVEDWKRDNGIVYDPNDAYSRGEGFFHDIGAFNPQAPDMLGEIAKVLLAQENKRRRGDLRYWEDTNNQLVVSSYTGSAGGNAEKPAFDTLPDGSHFVGAIGPDDFATFKKVSGTWFWVQGDYLQQEDTEHIKSIYESTPAEGSGQVRPGSGLRFVIRPAAHQILWAAKGDVYSGTVDTHRDNTPTGNETAIKELSSKPAGFSFKLSKKDNDSWMTKTDAGWVLIVKEGLDTYRYGTTIGNVAAEWRYANAETKVVVAPKAPAASKLNLLSPTVADAITERRSTNYNEFGVRLALGNFYIEGEELPQELRRLNKHLRRAFIAVHGSLDPVAPYTPTVLDRAAGPVSYSLEQAPADRILPEGALYSDLVKGSFVRLYRGVPQREADEGQWWTTSREKAARFGAVVTEVVLSAEAVGTYAAQGHGGGDEFVFTDPANRPSALAKRQQTAEQSAEQPAEAEELLASDVGESPAGPASVLNLMDGEDLAQAQELPKSAVGFTPDRGDNTLTNPDGSRSKAGQLMDRIREIRRDAQFEIPRYDSKETDRDYVRRVSEIRSLCGSRLTPLAMQMLTGDPGNAVREFDAELKAQIKRTAEAGGAGKRIADAVEKHLYRDRDGTSAPLQFFGSVQDFDRFKAMNKELGYTQTGANRELTQLIDAAEGREKEKLEAMRGEVNSLLNLAHVWTSATRMLRSDGSLENAAYAAQGHAVAETPAERESLRKPFEAAQAAFVAEHDYDGNLDDWNNFHVVFADPQVWYEGAVMPFLRGVGLRDILLDKAAVAAQVEAYRVANTMTALYAAGNDKGTILRQVKDKGGSFGLDGKGGYGFVPEELRTETRYFERDTLGRDIRREHLTLEEFAMARFALARVYAALGDGGINARMPVSGTVTFRDLPIDSKLNLSYDACKRRVQGLRADANGNPVRSYAIDIVITNARNNLPEAVFNEVEAAIKAAYSVFIKSWVSVAERDRLAIESLRNAGFANWRLDQDTRGQSFIKAATLTVPVKIVEDIWVNSSAFKKLVEVGGRDPEDLKLKRGMEVTEAAFRKLQASAHAAASWMLTDHAKDIAGVTSHIPFFSGTGFHSYLAKKAARPELPQYSEIMGARYRSLVETANQCFDENNKALPLAQAMKTRVLLKYYSDLFVKEGDPVKNDPRALLAELADRNSGRYLGDGATVWTLATRIYDESARRIHETVMRGGTLSPTELGDVSLEEFNAAVDTVAQERGVEDRRHGLTWSQIYEADGALPKNLGVDEALAEMAQNVAVTTRYRVAMNQALMSADENGMPLVYAEPGSDGDDTVPEAMWKQLAMWWADVHGETYDMSKSGRENARALYRKLVPGKLSATGEQGQDMGHVRWPFSDVKVPAGVTAFARVAAAANRAGDDTQSFMSSVAGGEAAAFMTQIMSIPGLGNAQTQTGWLNKILSWSKSTSVMWSFFFPIATAFESPWAAVGAKQTLAGLTKLTADAARKAGIDEGAPYMADILKVIGSDDVALAELKVHAVLCGLSLADRSHNMLDHDRTVIAKDIKRYSEAVASTMGPEAGRAAKAVLEGALEQSTEFAFEYVINATKLATFAQLVNRLRNQAVSEGRWFDPIRSMREMAPYINAEVGGIDPAMYAWSTPKAQRLMKALFFSWEWTLGAWSAGGGDIFTAKLFGMTSNPQLRQFMFGRWFRMLSGIMLGIPIAMQLLSTAVGKFSGDDDETKDDKWFSWMNERGHGWKDFDITPFLRMMAKIPGMKELKLAHPVAMSWYPALTGDEGATRTTGKRRYYAHMGKQGWEVAGWFQNPVKSFLGKMSMPAQRLLEGLFGFTPSMGWEKEWKDLGFWEPWTTLDLEKSALLNMFGVVVPFSAAGMYRSPEAGAVSMFMPVSKGMSKTRAEKEMARVFEDWGSAEGYVANWKGRPGAWTDLKAMVTDYADALRKNGYDPETSIKNALAAARKPLYARIHQALPVAPGMPADKAEIEAAARGLYRLDFVAKNLRKSIKARDKRQNISRVDEFAKITDEALKSAFADPYGRSGRTLLGTTRDAAYGGDVRGVLASDKTPGTLLGYTIVPQNQMTEAQRRYFTQNPQAAGHFETGKGTL